MEMLVSDKMYSYRLLPNLVQLGYEVNKEKESSASSKHEIT